MTVGPRLDSKVKCWRWTSSGGIGCTLLTPSVLPTVKQGDGCGGVHLMGREGLEVRL